MRPLYGDANDIQARAERAEELARHTIPREPDTGTVLTKAELKLLIDYHGQQETMADAMDMPESAEYHKRRGAVFIALREALTHTGERS